MMNVTIEPLEGQTGRNSPTGSAQTLVNDIEPLSVVSAVEKAYDVSGATTNGDTSLQSVARCVSPDMQLDDQASDLSLDERFALVEKKIEDAMQRVGSGQQDASEIMGHIFEHLGCSLKHNGTHPDPDLPGVQTDAITDLFCLTKVNNTIDLRRGSHLEQAVETTKKEVQMETWITAYPHPDPNVKDRRTPRTLH